MIVLLCRLVAVQDVCPPHQQWKAGFNIPVPIIPKFRVGHMPSQHRINESAVLTLVSERSGLSLNIPK